jgi:hypothetical protein
MLDPMSRTEFAFRSSSVPASFPYLAYYAQNDIGKDGGWDIWRLEGPSFVWHYRGAPHVHVWVNVADSPNVKLNA